MKEQQQLVISNHISQPAGDELICFAIPNAAHKHDSAESSSSVAKCSLALEQGACESKNRHCVN